MARTLDEIQEDALKLPEAQRDSLADTLRRSVHGEPEFSAAQIEEWDKRLAEMRAGDSLSYDEFFADEPR